MVVATGQVKYCISLMFCCWQLSNTRKVRGHIWNSHLRPGRTYRLRPPKGQIHEDELRGARSRGRKLGDMELGPSGWPLGGWAAERKALQTVPWLRTVNKLYRGKCVTKASPPSVGDGH